MAQLLGLHMFRRGGCQDMSKAGTLLASAVARAAYRVLSKVFGSVSWLTKGVLFQEYLKPRLEPERVVLPIRTTKLHGVRHSESCTFF